MLTPEQIEELKEQLSEQIQHLPQEQREAAQQQIEDMSPEALEAMLKQQKTSQKSVMRMIVDNEIPSHKLDENKFALAVLDIKPVSRGHILVIPKQKTILTSALPPQVLTLARKLAKHLVRKLKAKNTEIQTENKFGEQVINVIPVYEKPVTLNSPRYDASEKELSDLITLLKIKKRKTPQKKKQAIVATIQNSLIRLKRRIP
ncbi:MAG: HIT domain-containing protein [Nanoarchaeota archaeon]